MNFNDIADIDSIRLDTPIASDSVPRWQRKAAAAAAAAATASTSENFGANARLPLSTPQRTPCKVLSTTTPAKTPSKTPKVRQKKKTKFFEIFLNSEKTVVFALRHRATVSFRIEAR
jgi:hypothetical protein